MIKPELKQNARYGKQLSLLVILIAFVLPSCKKWTVPPELIGTWESVAVEVTVRTRTPEKEWVFTSGQAEVSITIHADRLVTGNIGSAAFTNGWIRKNPGNPEVRGLSEIIECGSIGLIFEGDPLDGKEVELWLAPMKEGTIDTELRYTEGRAQFPMSGMLLRKVAD